MLPPRVDAAGGKAIIFNTISISDGISMGTEGMKYSLVSREVIADSIETVVGCEGMDGVVAIGGCDKNMPGCLIALARLNRPAVFVYGGTILPGCIGGIVAGQRLKAKKAEIEKYGKRKLDIISVFEAVGQRANGKISERELTLIEENAIPGPGSCGGMYTANTMASAIEALGMSLPNSSAQDAISAAKMEDCQTAGQGGDQSAEKGNPSARHHDAESLRECHHCRHCAGRLDQCRAASAGHGACRQGQADHRRLHQDRPTRSRPGRSQTERTFPHGGTGRDRRFVPLMKTLLEEGLLHGDCMTVTGKTVKQNLANVAPYPSGQEVMRPFRDPIKKDSHLVVLYGNLAAEGAVAKISGKEGLQFTGKARVFEGEEAAMASILDGTVKKGDVIVIRYEGPERRTGHARNAGANFGRDGAGTGQGSGADHRRPFLRRQPRFRGGPHHARGVLRWIDRL